MSFAWPYSFLLALPLTIAAWRMLRRGRKAGVRFSAVSRLPARTAGWRARLANLAPLLFLVGCAALVLASARPRKALSRDSRNVDAIAIAMTVDVSGTMEALDLDPRFNSRTREIAKSQKYKTRLDVVKEMFAKFVSLRPDDLIGLVTFGGYAASRAPLTADHDALVHVLRGLEVPKISYDANGQPVDPDETMTAIGDGLAMAIQRLKNADMKSKIVILLSDGMSNSGAVQPDEAAAAAEKLGIRVYTIGVGTDSARTPFMVRDHFGREQIRFADTEFDESQLKSIAEKTHARYFSVRDKDGLERALEDIDQLEKTTLDRTVFQRWHEYFPPFLLAGAVLVLAAVSLQMAASRRLV